MAKKNVVITLAMIVAAGAAGLYTTAEVYEPLVAEGLVEVNPDMTNDKGEVATRATQKGTDSMNTQAKPAAAVKTAFVIEDSVAIPTVRRGRSGTEKYPFAQLQVGQSFFVAASEEMPEPAKALASTVSGATARYAVASETETKTNRKGEVVPVMVATRKFVVRAVEGGARIWRAE